MMGKTHVLWAGAVWVAAAPAVLTLNPGELAASTVVAMGCGVLPDIDCPRRTDRDPSTGLRTVKHGSTPAEAHGFASRWVARHVHAWAGGHRGRTHWAQTCVAAGVAVAPFVLLAPRLAVAVVLAVAGTWPIRLLSHGRARRLAPLSAAAAGLAAAGLVPAGWWLPLAVAAGALAHIIGDWLCRTRGGGVPILGPVVKDAHGRPERYELGLFHVDGPFEHALAWALHPTLLVLIWWRLDMLLPPSLRA